MWNRVEFEIKNISKPPKLDKVAPENNWEEVEKLKSKLEAIIPVRQGVTSWVWKSWG